MKTLKLSKYFELVRPKYCIYRILPIKSNKNYQSIKLSTAIALSYKSFDQRIKKINKKIFFDVDFKISFFLDMYESNCCFYIIFPDFLETLMMSKLNMIWSACTFEKVDNIKPFESGSIMYELSYKRDDALSLNTNLNSSEPLYSIISVQEQLKDDDRLSIIYNFSPCSQFNWKRRYKETMDKIKNHECVDKPNNSTEYKIKKIGLALSHFFESFRDTLGDFIGEENTKKQKESMMQAIMGILESDKDLSPSTKKKERALVIDTQIAVISSSKSNNRRESNSIATCQAYSQLGEKTGNELTYRKVNKHIPNVLDINIGTTYNVMSAEEVASTCLQIPGRNILNKSRMKSIQMAETQVPDELQKGVMCLGTNLYKGISKKAYLSEDEQFKFLTLVITGPTRAGKSNFLTHLCRDASNSSECSIIFDFCGIGKLSDEISAGVGGNILDINCADYEKLPPMDYCELDNKSNNPFDLYRSAKSKTEEYVAFINAINIDNKLEPRMLRYFRAASIITLMCNGGIKDVFDVLEYPDIRHKYIDSIPKDHVECISDYVRTLEELDDWSRGTAKTEPEIIGTKLSYIQGIINRAECIKANAYSEVMFLNKDKNKINLVEEMQKRDLICIRMPEDLFPTDQERDIFCTFWMTKILSSLQVRLKKYKEEDIKKVNLVIDELYQIPLCQSLLSKHINRIAKKKCKPIISCHSIAQLKGMGDELRSANTSYCLIAGSEKSNYYSLKEELEPYYDLEDMLNMKRFYSMNLIKINNGYSCFITKLPGRIGK